VRLLTMRQHFNPLWLISIGIRGSLSLGFHPRWRTVSRRE